jgi:lipopolysaccharide transport system permease protein
MLDLFRTIRDHRDLIVSFALRDIKARYKQTVLGVAWAVIQPFSLMVIFTLVFSLFAKVPSDGLPYPIFAYSSLVFWTFFSTVITGGTLAMVANSPLIRKIYFPRETLLIAVLISGAIDLAIASTIFAGMLVYYKIHVTVAVLWVIPLLLLQMVFSLGVISLTSAGHVNFRDIGHALPLVTQIWMLATPVAYPMSVIPEWLRPLYALNPMAPIIESYRRAILHGMRPDFAALGLAAVCVLLFTGIAFPLFKRAERTFADVI